MKKDASSGKLADAIPKKGGGTALTKGYGSMTAITAQSPLHGDGGGGGNRSSLTSAAAFLSSFRGSSGPKGAAAAGAALLSMSSAKTAARGIGSSDSTGAAASVSAKGIFRSASRGRVSQLHLSQLNLSATLRASRSNLLLSTRNSKHNSMSKSSSYARETASYNDTGSMQNAMFDLSAIPRAQFQQEAGGTPSFTRNNNNINNNNSFSSFCLMMKQDSLRSFTSHFTESSCDTAPRKPTRSMAADYQSTSTTATTTTASVTITSESSTIIAGTPPTSSSDLTNVNAAPHAGTAKTSSATTTNPAVVHYPMDAPPIIPRRTGLAPPSTADLEAAATTKKAVTQAVAEGTRRAMLDSVMTSNIRF